MKNTLIQLIVLTILLTAATAPAGYRETFEQEFIQADWAGGQSEVSVCIQCHNSEKMNRTMHELVRNWRSSWHATNEVSCHDCHGGDPEDASISMTHKSGFAGIPEGTAIPKMCGTCHIAIMNNYMASGHGQNFCVEAGPSCVTCHGSHDVREASIEIINEELCSGCHTYERARMMKDALTVVENEMTTIKEDLKKLQLAGMPLKEQEQAFFRTHSEFRTLFHTIDTSLVKKRTDEFVDKLAAIRSDINLANTQLAFRKNFAIFLFLIFTAMAAVIFMISRSVVRPDHTTTGNE